MSETVLRDKNGRPVIELQSATEGQWTPVLGGDGGTSGQTYSLQRGHYVKIGRLVWVSAYIALTAKGTITGNACILGLPFPNDGSLDTNNQPAFSVGWFSGLLVNKISLFASMLGNDLLTTRIGLYGLAAAAATPPALVTADIGNTQNIQIAGMYRTYE